MICFSVLDMLTPLLDSLSVFEEIRLHGNPKTTGSEAKLDFLSSALSGSADKSIVAIIIR